MEFLTQTWHRDTKAISPLRLLHYPGTYLIQFIEVRKNIQELKQIHIHSFGRTNL